MARALGAVSLAVGVAAIALGVHGYRADAALPFWAGVGLALASLAAGAAWAAGRGRSALLFAANTGIATLVGFAALEGLGGSDEEAGPPPRPAYTYEDAQGDPRAFRRWWEHYLREWLRSQKQYMVGLELKPSSRGLFFDSEVRINALGFRGPETTLEKRGRYRIVALGESTTYGATIRAGERPWPELLQERIDRELACARPVEVINGGVPIWTLRDHLERWDTRVQPLDPDLILSYHGYNGFHFLLDDLPTTSAAEPPVAPPRPSRLLRALEQRVRLARFERRYRAAHGEAAERSDAELLETRYARQYLALLAAARRADARVALASFNMAVTAESPEPVVAFYAGAFPDVRERILANALHSRLVARLANVPGVTAVDTSAGLDGAYEDAFIDLVHLTQAGRRRLADRMFEGLAPILRDEPGLDCRPRETA